MIPAVTLVLLAAPLATDRTFASDWGNHLWLVDAQAHAIGELGIPSYYLQSSLGAFYPYFAFYGGTFYAALGFLAWLTSAEFAVLLVSVAALAASYLGWTWLAHHAGLRGWVMQLPGLLAVTAPYAVTNVYGRGDIPEMVATSTLPLVAAAGLSLLREEEVRLGAAVAFVGGMAVLTGTHTLTLVWGTTFLLLCGAVFVACRRQAAREHARRGLRLLWLGVLAVAINAWMLVPLLLYHTRLVEGAPDPMSHLDFTDRTQLFSLFRNGAGLYENVTADLNTQLPVLLLLWTVAFGAVYWSALDRAGRRLAGGLAALAALTLLLIVSPSLVEALPDAWAYIQFPYRLLTYFDLALVGVVTLVLAAMATVGGSARVPTVLLVVVAVIGLYASVKQNFDVRSWLPDRAAAVASPTVPPSSWYAPLQFADASAPLVRPTLEGSLEVPSGAEIRDGYTLTVTPGKAGTMATNVLAGTYFVAVEGARPVGRLEGGQMVVSLPASDEPREVTFERSWDSAVDVGRWITLAALAVAAFGLVWMLADRERLPIPRRRNTRRGSK